MPLNDHDSKIFTLARQQLAKQEGRKVEPYFIAFTNSPFILGFVTGAEIAHSDGYTSATIKIETSDGRHTSANVAHVVSINERKEPEA